MEDPIKVSVWGNGQWQDLQGVKWVTYTADTTNYEVYAEKAAPADTCAHDAPLLKVTDGIAYCDGCGRSFELREFGS